MNAGSLTGQAFPTRRARPNMNTYRRENEEAVEARTSTASHPFGSQARKECVAIMVAPDSDTFTQARRTLAGANG